MNIFLMVAGGIFGIGVIAEKHEKKCKCMLAGFTVCYRAGCPANFMIRRKKTWLMN